MTESLIRIHKKTALAPIQFLKTWGCINRRPVDARFGRHEISSPLASFFYSRQHLQDDLAGVLRTVEILVRRLDLGKRHDLVNDHFDLPGLKQRPDLPVQLIRNYRLVLDTARAQR